MGWTNGRQLVTATDGDTDLSYTYNADGLRTTKTVDEVTHTYLYAGGKLLRETYGDTTLDFFYSSNGSPFALKLDEETYYYITNLQGDVLFLVDAEGNTVASYTYDPYGKVLTATGTMAETNPLRYRGYYYDAETGFYYLQSRYYDPTICRFINADGYASTGQGILGHNMFAYCLNNPVNHIDRGGTNAEALPWWAGAMGWLPFIDSVLPIGDIIYGAGILILGIYALTVADDVSVPQISLEEEKGEAEPEPPDVTYPGDDPTKAPDGYEWKGPDEQGGKRGGYANPNGKDSWHPDLDHPDGIDPHWDYNDGLGHKWRVFPNRIELVIK